MKLRDEKALKELIVKKGLTLSDVARSAGVSKGFISHLTAGRKSTMTPLVAYRIAERLDVPVSVLFEVKLPTADSRTAAGKVATAA